MRRREFLHVAGAWGAGAMLAPGLSALPGVARTAREPAFKVSLAGWSLHKRHFEAGKLPALEFPRVAREEFGIGAIELVNNMLPVPTYDFLRKLNAEAARHSVEILLIMCDSEGDLSSGRESERLQAVKNHHKWVDIAQVLGCHSIRVNAGGRPGDEEAIVRCADSLKRLGDYAAEGGINVLVENHGGMSSHPESLVKVMELAGSENVGTLPDFGNFPRNTDLYAAVGKMMPYAKAVSAKCYDFDQEGNETRIDFKRMMQVVVGAGYRGHVGIEYEGGRLSEAEGIRAAKKLLDKLALELA